MGALNHKIKKKNKTKSRSVGRPAHTHSHYSRKAKHTHREGERGRPLNAIKTKQKQLRCSAHAARQDGSGACRAKESTNGPAWVCMHIYNGHIIVCASWEEVRARVHAGGHTQREGRVCVRAVHGSLSLTLTRPPPQQQHTKQQEEAKEGRWCGGPRCCHHCRQSSALWFSWPWLRLVFSSDWLLYFHFVFLLASLHHQRLDPCRQLFECFGVLFYSMLSLYRKVKLAPPDRPLTSSLWCLYHLFLLAFSSLLHRPPLPPPCLHPSIPYQLHLLFSLCPCFLSFLLPFVILLLRFLVPIPLSFPVLFAPMLLLVV
ncbi:hypothetical protein TCDM_09481 [Trypanosoma cruzi Dm28c]|uniref:Uncharacterized protein n=1 Tax=Trypanosoma cruzi Dm28c TaxID=1416333 RepID=V5BEG3_TRYCR|nr:hypothetical protein TCDM_09481 [Trypanosoma cruzi Dm28c]